MFDKKGYFVVQFICDNTLTVLSHKKIRYQEESVCNTSAYEGKWTDGIWYDLHILSTHDTERCAREDLDGIRKLPAKKLKSLLRSIKMGEKKKATHHGVLHEMQRPVANESKSSHSSAHEVLMTGEATQPLQEEVISLSAEMTKITSTSLQDEALSSAVMNRITATPLQDKVCSSAEMSRITATPLPDEMCSTAEMSRITEYPLQDEVYSTAEMSRITATPLQDEACSSAEITTRFTATPLEMEVYSLTAHNLQLHSDICESVKSTKDSIQSKTNCDNAYFTQSGNLGVSIPEQAPTNHLNVPEIGKDQIVDTYLLQMTLHQDIEKSNQSEILIDENSSPLVPIASPVPVEIETCIDEQIGNQITVCDDMREIHTNINSYPVELQSDIYFFDPADQTMKKRIQTTPDSKKEISQVTPPCKKSTNKPPFFKGLDVTSNLLLSPCSVDSGIVEQEDSSCDEIYVGTNISERIEDFDQCGPLDEKDSEENIPPEESLPKMPSLEDDPTIVHLLNLSLEATQVLDQVISQHEVLVNNISKTNPIPNDPDPSDDGDSSGTEEIEESSSGEEAAENFKETPSMQTRSGNKTSVGKKKVNKPAASTEDSENDSTFQPHSSDDNYSEDTNDDEDFEPPPAKRKRSQIKSTVLKKKTPLPTPSTDQVEFDTSNSTSSIPLEPETYEFDDTVSSTNKIGPFQVDKTKISPTIFKTETVPKAYSKDSKFYDRKDYCYFCGRWQTRLDRHLFDMHPKDPQVSCIRRYGLQSKERRQAIQMLRHKGNFLYNMKVERGELDGPLKVARRSRCDKNDSSDYENCYMCRGLFMKKFIRHHIKKCQIVNNVTGVSIREARRMGRITDPLVKTTVPKKLADIVDGMNADEVSRIVKNDCLIMAYGKQQLKKNPLEQGSSKQKVTAQLREKLRELGRLVVTLKSLDAGIIQLSDIFKPEKVELFFMAVKALTDYNEETEVYGKPGLALKIGHLVNPLCFILKNQAILYRNEALRKDVKFFEEMVRSQWSTEVSHNAKFVLASRKFNKPRILPLTEDIVLVFKFLKSEAAQLKERYKKYSTEVDLFAFMENCVVRLIYFNRKRVGEVESMLLSVFQERNNKKLDSDMQKILTPLETVLANQFERVVVRGKKGRGVPILIYPSLLEDIEFLVSERCKFDIPSSNPHLFVRRSNKSSHVNGSAAMRKSALAAGAKQPHLLTSTYLRKHIATSCQLLALRENELDGVANFMGHNILIHREYYRLQSDVLELARVSKLFVAAANGTLSNHKGKNLDEINISVEDTVELNSNELLQMETECGANQKKGRPRQRVTNQEDDQEQEGEGDMTGPSTSGAGDQLAHSSTQNNVLIASESETEEPSCDTDKPSGETEELGSDIEDREAPPILKKRKNVFKFKAATTTKASTRKAARPWSAAELKCVKTFLSSEIAALKIPVKAACVAAIDKSDGVLTSRSWKDVKYAAKNFIVKLRKKL